MIMIRLQNKIKAGKMLDELNTWIGDLPGTKRRHRAYRIINKNGVDHRTPAIVFVRRDDAVAFRMKFGL